jgi:hypothetical protein
MSASPPPMPSQQLSPQQIQEMEQARARYKQIRRAITSATFFGWSVAIFGGLSLLCTFADFGFAGIFVSIGLCVIGYVELTHVAKLKKLQPESARVLGKNQFALAAVLTIYALWQLAFPTPLSAEAKAQLDQVKSVMDIEQMERLVRVAVYVVLIAVAIGVEGSMAFFYFRREAMVKDFLANTPPWIVAMLQNGMSL